jgi:hypothetical protein
MVKHSCRPAMTGISTVNCFSENWRLVQASKQAIGIHPQLILKTAAGSGKESGRSR